MFFLYTYSGDSFSFMRSLLPFCMRVGRGNGIFVEIRIDVYYQPGMLHDEKCQFRLGVYRLSLITTA